MLAEVEQLLLETIGLDPAAIGRPAIQRAVERRCEQCALPGAADYVRRVRHSQRELQALIETVVVPETWFFRDPAAFEALARYVREEWLAAHPQGVLRLLSAGCSTGEEPYSMAMALLESGVPAARFTIDALDISTHALAVARHAVYGKNSFRSEDLGFRALHMLEATLGHELKPAPRARVHFRAGNLLDTELLAARTPYGVIFCRNLLIYLDRASQQRVVGSLTAALEAGGLLFVGPSESGLLAGQELIYTRWRRSFAFRKAAANPGSGVSTARARDVAAERSRA